MNGFGLVVLLAVTAAPEGQWQVRDEFMRVDRFAVEVWNSESNASDVDLGWNCALRGESRELLLIRHGFRSRAEARAACLRILRALLERPAE